MKYPNSSKAYFVEEIFGTSVEDSYRWMENETDERLKVWIDEQNKVTQSVLEQIEGKDQIKERLKSLYNYPKYDDVRVIGENIIYQYNDGLNNQSIYYIQKGLDGQAKVLLDPNTLSEGGTVAIDLNGASKDNRYLAYLQADAGSDWHEIRIIDLETLEILEDKLEWVKFTFVSWKDHGFYYSAYEKPDEDKALSQKNTNMKVYYHVLGQSQDQDVLVYSDDDNPLRYHSTFVTEDLKNLILISRQGTYGSQVGVLKDHKLEPVFEGFDTQQIYINSKGSKAYFISDEQAENKKVVCLDTESLEVSCIIEESDDNIQTAHIVRDKLIVTYLKDVKSIVKVYSLQGDYMGDIDLPGIGTPFNFTSSDNYNQVFFSYTSYISPTTLFAYDFELQRTGVFKESKISYDSSDYITEQIFSKSKDGTMIPSFVTYKKGTSLNGSNPTMLYAYGGFNNAVKPNFKPSVIYFIEQGGIHVEAGIRGGSEYGQAWHKDGMLFKKQNVFDDFISVAEDLIQRKYTSKEHLAASGRSNGGLLMGAILNQRPDLFKVVFPIVGVMDMLRYHRFTVGWGWAVEYGNPEEKEHFENIIKYSPYHNIKDKDYPATMVLTADHDDRVVPSHSFKYISRLQETNTSDYPVIIRIDKDAGHGAGKSVEKLMDEESDKLSFMLSYIK
ncbi:prolyl oligopeptidase family protein [Acidaminobacter sp. JC074]|uniref:prolyl oligopeptidase family serine peptidase n=1 Tax=Acidaminobacter sp. JC074 TaxID=2530199 RepID=UPI001F104DA7|nr:prolyl oligopeptidase family serine peptidase [Acidaminobacter sp. JC074]